MGLASAAITFSAAANEPYIEQQTSDIDDGKKAACTVRLNEFEGSKTEPIDTRYIGTRFADPGHEDYDSGLFWSAGWRGISYYQEERIAHKFPDEIHGTFQAEINLHDWHMPDGTYYDAGGALDRTPKYLGSVTFGTNGELYDAQHTNWGRSAEIEIDNPGTCLYIRGLLEEAQKTPPDFHLFAPLFGNETNASFTNRIWEITGQSSDFDTLQNTDGITMLDRSDLLEEKGIDPNANRDNPDLIAPYKP